MNKITQPFTPDDPRLTAYAHGELHDPAEKAALEASLAEDPALSEALEEIRALNALLADGFAKDLQAAPATDVAANVVHFRLPPEDSAKKARIAHRHKFVLIATALAASIALAITVFVSPSPRQSTDALALGKDGAAKYETPTESTSAVESDPSITAALEIELIDAVEAEERRQLALGRDEAPKEETSKPASRTAQIYTFNEDGISSLPTYTVETEPPPTPHASVATAASSRVVQSASESTLGSILSEPLQKITGADIPTLSNIDVTSPKSAAAKYIDEVDFQTIFNNPELLELAQRSRSYEVPPSNMPEMPPHPPEQSYVGALILGNGEYIYLPEFHIVTDESDYNSPYLYKNPNLKTEPRESNSEISNSIYEPQQKSSVSKNTRRYQKLNHRTTTHDTIVDNPFRSVKDEALSTFSIDVDTAAYAQVRNYIEYDELPPKGAVRIEELINYFEYDYAPPTTRLEPFAVHLDAMDTPWAREHKLVRIALKGYEIPWEERPASNLVFLVDVSGSMDEPNKLPLVQEALAHLVKRLDRRDRVAIVTYAGSAGLALPSTTADNRETILHALENLEAGGSTQGSAGIKLAYELARKHFKKEGTNRVFLCTDGDFNIGITNRSELVSLIEEEAKSGVFLSVIGFGMGNYKDDTLEELSNKGNGNYAYIDSRQEAHRVFRQQISGTLTTIAKDVKIQVEFNPAYVASYRLIGYENRQLNKEDFNDDTKDAGEIGAGHTVTALYEIIPAGEKAEKPAVDPLKYQTAPELAEAARESGEFLTVKLRYKEPDGHESKLIEKVLSERAVRTGKPDSDFRFAASVAAFGMLLRESPHAGDASFDKVYQWASDSAQTDDDGSRSEFLELIKAANSLSKQEG